MYRIQDTASAKSCDRRGSGQEFGIVEFRSRKPFSNSPQPCAPEGMRRNLLSSLVWGVVLGFLASLAYFGLIAGIHAAIYGQFANLPRFAAFCLATGSFLGLLGGVSFALVKRNR
jgi:hypothetical protein